MNDCVICEADTFIVQDGRFRRVFCTECERELRPNGEPVPVDFASQRLHDKVRNSIAEQYVDLIKDMEGY